METEKGGYMQFLRLCTIVACLVVGVYAAYRYNIGNFASKAEADMWWQLAALALIICVGMEIVRILEEEP